MFYRRFGKRALDLALSLLALALLSPLLLIVAALVRAKLGAPVLFRQVRPGRGGKPFAMVKFRTMTDARDAQGKLLPDVQRMTSLGRLLRRTSLDELPELWNVVRGEMSLVGPRPLLVDYLPYYTPRERLRFAVRPGLTGWAQLHGRSGAPWDQRLEHDAWYAEHGSLRLDVRILLDTVRQVINREDAHEVAILILPRLDDERRARAGGSS